MATLTITGGSNVGWCHQNIGRRLPIAVVALSLFNIGYFSKIGFHFLGIVDLKNLVYTFGLAMLALWILAVPVVIYANTFSKPMSETSIRRTTRATNIIRWIGAGVFLLAVFMSFRSSSLDETLLAGGAIVGLSFYLIGLSVLTFLSYKVSGIVTANDFVSVALAASVFFFYAGIFMYKVEITDPSQRYNIKMKDKDSAIENARLLRSSSAGFILLDAEGRILFIPHSAITEIKSTTPLATPLAEKSK